LSVNKSVNFKLNSASSVQLRRSVRAFSQLCVYDVDYGKRNSGVFSVNHWGSQQSMGVSNLRKVLFLQQ